MADEFDTDAIKQELVKAVVKELDVFSTKLDSFENEFTDLKKAVNDDVDAIKASYDKTKENVDQIIGSNSVVKPIGIGIFLAVLFGGGISGLTLWNLGLTVGTLKTEFSSLKSQVEKLPSDVSAKLVQNTDSLVQVNKDLTAASESLESSSDAIANVEKVTNSNAFLITELNKSVSTITESVAELQRKTKALDDFEKLPEQVGEVVENVKVAATDAKAAVTEAKAASALASKNSQEIAMISATVGRDPSRYSLVATLREVETHDETSGAFVFRTELVEVKEAVRVVDIQVLRMTGPALDTSLTLRGHLEESSAVVITMFAPLGSQEQVSDFFANKGSLVVQVKLEAAK